MLQRLNAQHKGFGILEIIAALAVIALILTVAMPLLKTTTKNTNYQQDLNTQAEHMAAIKNAMQGWASLHEQGAVLDATVSIQIDDLIGEGLLPAGFAQRSGTSAAGESPLGATYKIYARKELVNGDELLRAIIVDEGNVKLESLIKMGIEYKTSTAQKTLLRQWAVGVNNALSKIQHVLGGINASSTKIANGPNGAFSIDLSNYLPSTDTIRARTIVFYGFVSLEPDGNVDGNNTTSITYSSAQCNLIMPNGADASCIAPSKEVVRFVPCTKDLPNIIGIAEIGGTITWGYDLYTEYSGYTDAITRNSVIYSGTYQNIIYDRLFVVNNSDVTRFSCAKMTWHKGTNPAGEHSGTFWSGPHAHYEQLQSSPANKETLCQSDDDIEVEPVSYTTAGSSKPRADMYCLGNTEYNPDKFNAKLTVKTGYEAALCCQN